jgi:hypothetical protein
MKVFISWSGARSQAVAEALHEWLPNVIQAIEPWMSASDIEKGARWSADIALQLEEARVGIICLTADNLEAPWILFEAGALSKTIEKTFVCPFLFDVEPSDLKGPLVQFQATRAQRGDSKKLIHTINQALGDEALVDHKVEKAFDVWWPQLEERLRLVPKGNLIESHRSEREMIEEMLELIRSQARGDITPPWVSSLLSTQTQNSLLSELKQESETDTSIQVKASDEMLPPSAKRRVYERVALKLREFAGVSLDQPLNPWNLAPYIKLRITDINDIQGFTEETRNALLGDMGKRWSGGASRPLSDGSRLVFLNPNHTREQQAATLMEEICHIILGHAPTRLTLADEIKTSIHFNNFGENQEEVAYAIGTAALVPYFTLRTSIQAGLSAERIARQFLVSRSLVEYRIKVCRLWSEYKERSRSLRSRKKNKKS